MNGMFSYHLSCLPQAQCERPVIGSPFGTRSMTTPRNEAIEAPRKNARMVIVKVRVAMSMLCLSAWCPFLEVKVRLPQGKWGTVCRFPKIIKIPGQEVKISASFSW